MKNKICVVPAVPEATGYIALRYVSTFGNDDGFNVLRLVVLIEVLQMGFRF